MWCAFDSPKMNLTQKKNYTINSMFAVNVLVLMVFNGENKSRDSDLFVLSLEWLTLMKEPECGCILRSFLTRKMFKCHGMAWHWAVSIPGSLRCDCFKLCCLFFFIVWNLLISTGISCALPFLLIFKLVGSTYQYFVEKFHSSYFNVTLNDSLYLSTIVPLT